MKLQRLLQAGCVLTLSLISAQAQGQVVRYKQANNPKLDTKTEVDTSVQVMNRRYKSAGYEFHPRIDKTITRSDSTIYEYMLFGNPTREAVLAHQQKLSALVGKPLPPFTLADLQGKLVSSKSLLGKPVVLNLWFTSCVPCIGEMPTLNRIRNEKAQSGVVFIAVTFDNKEKVQAFLKKQPFAFQHLVGAKQYCTQFTSGYPTTLFVDKSGIIRNVRGALSPKQDEAAQQAPSADEREFYAALKLIE